MGQAVLRVEGLPGGTSAAAAAFYADWLPRARAALDPPRSGNDLAIVFPSMPCEHRGWRLAAVQDLAREAAPGRVNAVAGDDAEAIAATLEWLSAAPGVTGQVLAVDGNSARNG